MRTIRTFVVTALLLGLLALPVGAAAHEHAQRPVALQQEQLMATVTLFPIANTGTTPRTSATVNYNGAASALFTLLSNTWATDNSSIVVTFAIQQSFDSGATWQDFCSTQWSPQTNWGKGGPPTLPSIQCTAEDVSGSRLLRAQLSATSTLQVGIQATV